MAETPRAGGHLIQPDELVSLAERMGYLQALRVVMVVVVSAASLFASRVIGATIEDLTLATAAYLLISAAVEGLRRVGRGRRIGLIGGMLLLDGVYLAYVMYVTGGTQSPLRFLVYVHLIAVTLLASYRTGLKITLWHSLLFFVVFNAQAANLIDPVESSAEVGSGQQPSLFNVVAFWLVALGTAAFSSLNERELRRRRGDLEDLAGMARNLETVQGPREVAANLLERLSKSFGFKRGVVVAAPTGEQFSLMAYRGPGDPPEVAAGRDAAVDQALREHKPVLLKKLDPEANPQLAAALPFAQNVIVVPMFAESHAVGALAVEYSAKLGFRVERRVVSMASQFAAHAALALRNAWLLEQVQRMAETDALTGLPNRRVFHETLERELSRSARTGDPVTLVMMDIDHFKQLNDTHGHQAGDEVLRKVAAALARDSRDFDTPVRYGGEEFAVILPSCSAKESLVAGDRLRNAVANSDTPVPVTASAGVATFPIHAADPQRLIAAADEALYESKRAGRNRVTRSRRRASGVARVNVPVND